jgi:hypothetical protein
MAYERVFTGMLRKEVAMLRQQAGTLD